VPATPPPPLDRIFVSIASYCDPLLPFTLRSAISQASRPGRLAFGIVEQHLPGQAFQTPADWACGPRWLRLPAEQSRGACWARALAMTLYQGEAWYLQVDSHTWFEPGWDESLILAAQRCAALNPRSLLSCYPNPFRMVDGQPRAQLVSSSVLAHVVKQDQAFAPDHPVLLFECVPVHSSEPVAALHLAAGALFGPGQLVEELPYDPQLFFHGEEQAYALRAWTRGWDIFHVPRMPLYHLYTEPGQNPRPMHWHAEHDAWRTAQRQANSVQLTQHAHRRLAALLWEGAELGAYGLGRARTLADYAAFSGIDYAARKIEPRATKARFGY
jgi:hypothetical protein